MSIMEGYFIFLIKVSYSLLFLVLPPQEVWILRYYKTFLLSIVVSLYGVKVRKKKQDKKEERKHAVNHIIN